jgi:predicted enzyme related to lactoylglutathione lyase
MASNRPVHFEIHAADPDRAAAFYAALFGWTFTKWDGPMPYWLIATGTGTGVDGGMMPRQGSPPEDGQPVNAWVMTVDVASVDESLAAALEHGGTLAVPRMPIPGMGWLAYAKDPEGNIFGMMENDPAAG